jgi:hypothetical protein
MNSLMLFTHEQPSNVDSYRVYTDLSSVGADYGTTSITYNMANAIFSQSPNIISGSGRLVIAPLQTATSATAGNNVGVDISANLPALKAVSDGDIEITIDGTVVPLTDLNFTGAVTLSDVASVIEDKIGSLASVTASSTAITIKSKTVGTTSAITIAQLAGGTGTDLSVAGLLNVAAGTNTAGTDATGETLTDAVARLNNLVQFVGFMTTQHLQDAAITAVSFTDKIFLHHLASSSNYAGIATTIKDANKTQVRLISSLSGLDEARLLKAAYASRAFSVLLSGTSTTLTMNAKSLTGVNADIYMTETLKTQAIDAGVDILPSVDNRITKTLTSGANGYFDDVYNELALKLDLEVATFNVLATSNNKVPQTEVGMAVLVNSINRVLNQYITNGYIGVGNSWNGATFGNPEDFLRLITEQGYYVYYMPISQQSQVDREARKAPIIQIALKTAGAIHKVIGLVNVEA